MCAMMFLYKKRLHICNASLLALLLKEPKRNNNFYAKPYRYSLAGKT